MSIHRRLWLLLPGVCLLLWSAGCSTSGVKQPLSANHAPDGGYNLPRFEAVDLTARVQQPGYLQKMDSFIVLVDTALVDGDGFHSISGKRQGKEILRRLVLTLPESGFHGALTVFGRSYGGESAGHLLDYGRFDRESWLSALNDIETAGSSGNLDRVLDGVASELLRLGRSTAVIIIAPWAEISTKVRPAAERFLSRSFGSSCIYIIGVGAGAQLFGPPPGGCGRGAGAETIASGGAMADFVEKIFFAGAVDSDADGIYDHLDQCPRTLPDVKVDWNGCRRENRRFIDTQEDNWPATGLADKQDAASVQEKVW